jgi:hypothetical protein
MGPLTVSARSGGWLVRYLVWPVGGKTQAEVTINRNDIRYRMLGLEYPVSDVKVEGPVLTFSVGLNGEHSTVVLRRTETGAEAAFLSPGGTRHEGRFINLASPSPQAFSPIDAAPTSSITPAPEDLRKR